MIATVRQHLLDTLTDLRSKENPMSVDRARAVAEVASVIVNTAKVEVEYLKATQQRRGAFFEALPVPVQMSATTAKPDERSTTPGTGD